MDTAHSTAQLTPADRLRHIDAVQDETDLRHHLEHDHGSTVYDNDEAEHLQAAHDHLHRRPAVAPAPPEAPAEVVLARQTQELALREKQEAAYDVGVPTTLRERLAYSRALAGAGIIPKAFRSTRPGEDGAKETTANVFLATELGAVFGMHPLTALGSINVVEGKPGLGAEAQLAQALEKGHDLEVASDESTDQVGVVYVQRRKDGQPVGKRHRVTFTIEDAVRAGLCRLVDGVAYARSSAGKPLPWETSTPDMLVWRAVTRACKRYLPDVTAGLAAYDGEPGDQAPAGRPAAASSSSTTAEQVQPPARVQPAPADDTVQADLELFTDRTGPWWTHAKAEVRRRSKLQLAADRLQAAHDRGDDRVPTPTAPEVVDAEVVDDTGQPAPVPADEPAAEPELATVVDVGAEAAELEQALAEQAPGLSLVPDAPTDEAQQVELGHADTDQLLGDPSLDAVPGAGDEPLPDDEDGSAEDVPGDRRAQLWAEVEALAVARDKSTTQLLGRHVLATRKNPEDMDADDLQAFLDAQQR